MKKVLIGLVVVLVVIGGVGVYVFLSAGDIVKQVVEDVGSRATQTKVTLSGVDLSIQSGEAALKGFNMGNPTGFNSAKAMSFDLVSVKLDTGSLTGDTILVKEVVIARPEIIYEISGGGSNIGTIQKNVDSFAKAMGGGAGGGAAKKDESASGGKKVIIENLYVRDGKVSVSANFLQGKAMGAPLPAIHLKDIGKAKGGATPAEVADQLLTAISQSAAKAVNSLDLGKMMEGAKGAAEGAKKMLEGGAGGAGKAIDDTTKGVGDSIKGIFGK
jgi:hypothetical protein